MELYLKDHDLSGIDISVMKPVDAIRVSMERATDGKDTISVTGNVLRDYLTVSFISLSPLLMSCILFPN